MSTSPRLFISYSWSTPEHEQWVIDLAEELVSSGVDVILDKWELREGHDSIAFMEKSVTDTTIKKVIIICDKLYATKANGRSGGVGTETQIISSEIYAQQEQEKFVAVIAEKDENGKPFLPVYYKSRIFIDLSQSEKYSENYEKLVRWIFNKPLHIKPEIGKPPAFISTPDAVNFGTASLAKRVVEGLRQDKGYTRGAIQEYFTTLSDNFERLRISRKEGFWDEQIYQSIDSFISTRDEYIHVLSTLCQYTDPGPYAPAIHKFFEALIPYHSRPPSVSAWREDDFDNFKFITHELFLYTIAIMLRGEHIDVANYLLHQKFYVVDEASATNSTPNYTIFREYIRSLDARNERLKLGRLSLRADLLEQRSKSSGIQFRHIMQADFICYLRADFTNENTFDGWFPETLIYASRNRGAFEIFARAKSRAYLAKILSLIGVSSLQALKEKISEQASNRRIPTWQYSSFSPRSLLGLDELGTQA